MVFNNHLISQRRDLKQHFKFQRVEERHRLSNTQCNFIHHIYTPGPAFVNALNQ
jgi:hypothetical protein